MEIELEIIDVMRENLINAEEKLEEAKRKFGKALKSERESSGLSLRELGKKLKLSQSALHDFEKGRRFPSNSTMKRIKVYFIPITSQKIDK